MAASSCAEFLIQSRAPRMEAPSLEGWFRDLQSKASAKRTRRYGGKSQPSTVKRKLDFSFSQIKYQRG